MRSAGRWRFWRSALPQPSRASGPEMPLLSAQAFRTRARLIIFAGSQKIFGTPVVARVATANSEGDSKLVARTDRA